MECTEVQEKLSAYVDGMVSSQERMFIDGHLKACGKCHDSLVELKKTLQYVQNLEEMEPPPWLVQQVMARVREQRRGILAWLFHPLHIKLPIEAVAAILIAITTVYVFKSIHPEMKVAKVPLEDGRPLTSSGEKEKTPAIGSGQPGISTGSEQLMATKKRETSRERLLEAPRAPSRVAKRERAAPFPGAVLKGEAQPKTPGSTLRAAGVEGKKRVMSLALHVEEIEAATKELEEVFMELGGKIIKREYAERRFLIVGELDSGKMDELMEKMGPLGKIEEKAVTLEAREGDVEVWIEIYGKP